MQVSVSEQSVVHQSTNLILIFTLADLIFLYLYTRRHREGLGRGRRQEGYFNVSQELGGGRGERLR